MNKVNTKPNSTEQMQTSIISFSELVMIGKAKENWAPQIGFALSFTTAELESGNTFRPLAASSSRIRQKESTSFSKRALFTVTAK
jgi:hypothetical protein